MNTIAAISTPDAAGGIAMIRISGTEALRIADEIFTAANGVKITDMRGYTCAYGTVSDGTETLDDVVLTVFRAPHSYTGEDTVEITCHGGIYLTKRILMTVYLHIHNTHYVLTFYDLRPYMLMRLHILGYHLLVIHECQRLAVAFHMAIYYW